MRAWWGRAVDFDRSHPALTDLVVTLVLAAVSVPWSLDHSPRTASDWLFDAGLLLPLVWRRRHPEAVFAFIASVACVQWFVGAPLVSDLALLVALFTIALERPLFRAIIAGAAVEVGVLMASFKWGLTDSWIRSILALSGLAAAAFLFGAVLRTRRAHLVELTERAYRLEIERDQQAQMAAAEERTRIAREMHDVIAHSLAVVVAMADGASAKLSKDPDQAADAIRAISDVGRQALGDTRRLLGVLRESGPAGGIGAGVVSAGGADLAPQPGFDQIGPLIEQFRATGLDAAIETEGRRFALPPGAELTVFRLLQEAGTNTLKHATGATRFTARLIYDYPRLVIEATDNGQAGTPPAALVASGPSAGHGLDGMRERVALYGGTVSAGPGPAGGWVVTAEIAA